MDFESIYKAYRQDVFQYITSLTGANSLDAAEELSAETFFRDVHRLSFLPWRGKHKDMALS